MLFGASAILLYLIATGMVARLLGRDYRTLKQQNRSSFWRLSPAWAAAICHIGALIPVLWTPEGINFAFLASLTLASLIVVLLLLMGALSKPLDTLGLAIFPGAALSIFLMLRYPPYVRTLGDMTLGLQGHILISILSFCMLNIASLQAAVLAVQDSQLRSHRPNRLIQALPPLQAMESLLFQIITIGFILLTVSLASGSIYIDNLVEQHLLHKIVLSSLAWLVFAVLLWGRFRYGWRGQTAIRWTLGGFFSLLLAYFGTKIVLEIFLQRI